IPNNLAWALAIRAGRPPGDYDESVVLAHKSIQMQPKYGGAYNTLALAEYRRGRWNDCIAASERSMELNLGGEASDWFLLAMARSRKGENDLAATWFEKAMAWTRKNAPADRELLQLWSEAAVLLGRPDPRTPPALPRDVFAR